MVISMETTAQDLPVTSICLAINCYGDVHQSSRAVSVVLWTGFAQIPLRLIQNHRGQALPSKIQTNVCFPKTKDLVKWQKKCGTLTFLTGNVSHSSMEAAEETKTNFRPKRNARMLVEN